MQFTQSEIRTIKGALAVAKQTFRTDISRLRDPRMNGNGEVLAKAYENQIADIQRVLSKLGE